MAVKTLKKPVKIKEAGLRKKPVVVGHVIIDTREQDPWDFKDSSFPSGFEIGIRYSDKLEAGDYSLVGYDLPSDDYGIVIERKKDLVEFIGNVGNKKNWARFQRELEKLSKFRTAVIVIEDDLNNAYARYKTRRGRQRYFNVPPDFLMGRFAEIKQNFGVDVFLASDRGLAQRYACNLFKQSMLLDAALDKI